MYEENPIIHSNRTNYEYNLDNFQPPTNYYKVVTDRNRSETQELFILDFKDRSPYRNNVARLYGLYSDRREFL